MGSIQGRVVKRTGFQTVVRFYPVATRGTAFKILPSATENVHLKTVDKIKVSLVVFYVLEFTYILAICLGSF